MMIINKVIEQFDDKFSFKDLRDSGFSKIQAQKVIDDMLENGMICEDMQYPASKSSKNIHGKAKTPIYWILSKATDEDDLLENLEDIKNQNEIEED
jgi:hypothetical protein